MGQVTGCFHLPVIKKQFFTFNLSRSMKNEENSGSKEVVFL
jgi:hypothetical protein